VKAGANGGDERLFVRGHERKVSWCKAVVLLMLLMCKAVVLLMLLKLMPIDYRVCPRV
jgi:hypothetical protein